MRRISGWMTLTLLLWTTPGVSQSTAPLVRGRWAIGLSLGMSSFTPATEGKDPDGRTIQFSAYRPTMWGVAIAFGKQRSRLEASVRVGTAGLGARGATIGDGEEPAQGALVVVDGAYDLMSFALGGSTRLLRLRGGPALRPSLALDLERWTGVGSPTRSVLAGQAGLTLEFALTRAFVGTLEGELGYSPASPFRKEDVPQDFVRHGVWRRTLAGGFYWRF